MTPAANNTATYSIIAISLLAISSTFVSDTRALGHNATNKQVINPSITKVTEDETTYLLKPEKNRERILASLKDTKGTTYQNLQEFKRAYNL